MRFLIMGKALFLVIGIAGFLGSCRSDDNMANRYLFHEVAGTKNLKYNAGEIEGVIFQDEIKSSKKKILKFFKNT
jgi:hypothetical protein